MTRILHIDASARPGLAGLEPHGSKSRRLGHAFVERWRARRPDTEITYRDVGLNPPAHVDHAWIQAVFSPDYPPERAAEVLKESDLLIDELFEADVLVLGMPMYNFGMPSAFKAWVDNIVRLGRTLPLDPTGAEPFTAAFRGRELPVVLLTSRGDHGMDPGGPHADENHLDPGVRTALGFIGLDEIHSIAVEHDAEGGERLAASLASALQRTTDLADALIERRT